MPGIARDIALGLGWAVLAVFFLALCLAGLMISAMDPVPDPEPDEEGAVQRAGEDSNLGPSP